MKTKWKKIKNILNHFFFLFFIIYRLENINWGQAPLIKLFSEAEFQTKWLYESEKNLTINSNYQKDEKRISGLGPYEPMNNWITNKKKKNNIRKSIIKVRISVLLRIKHRAIMFGLKIRSWMENHIRPRKKGNKNKNGNRYVMCYWAVNIVSTKHLLEQIKKVLAIKWFTGEIC